MISKTDKYEFAASLIVGHSKDLIDTAIINAYPSLQRTFRFKGKDHKEPINLAHIEIRVFVNNMRALIETMESNNETSYNIKIQKSIDNSFKNTCNHIVEIFKEYGFDCHYGQAQKWINITMKHLVLYSDFFDCLTPYLHMPIDNVVYSMVESLLNIPKPKVAWSRMNENQYTTYQTSIRNKLKEERPFEWEWVRWKDWNFKEDNF